MTSSPFAGIASVKKQDISFFNQKMGNINFLIGKRFLKNFQKDKENFQKDKEKLEKPKRDK